MNQTVSWPTLGRQILASTICPLGIISSILALCTFWRKLEIEKSSFFIFMFLVSVFDLIFSITYICIKWGDPSTWFFAICHGVTFSASFASDLCTLALTTERYISLRWPHKTLPDKYKKCTYTIIGILIFLISSTRLRYFLRDNAFLSITPPWFLPYSDKISSYVGMATDNAIPLIGLIFMGFFSFKIAKTIVKRARNRVAHQSSNQEPSVIKNNWLQEQLSPAILASGSVSNAPIVQIQEDPSQKEMGVQVSQSQATSSSPRAYGNQILNIPSSFQKISYIDHLKYFHQQRMKEKRDQANTMITLVLIVGLLFLLNQIGYCLSSSAYIYFTSCGNCNEGFNVLRTCAFLCDTAECLSHSLNFYFYLCFSKMIRDEFKRLMLKLGIKI